MYFMVIPLWAKATFWGFVSGSALLVGASLGYWVKQSGLSQKAWRENHNLTYSTFHCRYKWYRNQHGAIPQKVSSEGSVQLLVRDEAGSGWCELEWDEGKKLVFCPLLSAEFLKKSATYGKLVN